MSDNITPYIIRIQTALEKGGVQGAKDELAALTAETEKAKKASEEAGESTADMGQSVGKAAELTGKLTAAMAQGGPEAQRLGAGMGVLKSLIEGSSSGIAGLATVIAGVAVSAFVAYRNKVAESKKQLEEFYAQIEANKRASDAAGVERLAGQYDVLRKSVDEATAATERLNQAQAAADNAEKAARMADITLREKVAQNALKPDDKLGSARVSARFAGERRDLESEYQIRDSERAAQAKASALSDAERKQSITEGMDIPAAKAKMQEFENNIERVNAALENLYGAGAPTKRVQDITSARGVGAWKTVVDEEEQARQAAVLKSQLVEVDKDGKPTGKGFEPNYQKAAEALSAAIDKLAREKVETQARRIEADAAAKMLLVSREMTPRINAQDSAADARNVRQQNAEANEALFGDRLQTLKGDAKSAFRDSRAAADKLDPTKMQRRGGDYNEYRAAVRDDEATEDVAKKTKGFLDALLALEEKIKATPFEQMSKSVSATNARLDEIARGLNNLKAQTARPGSGG